MAVGLARIASRCSGPRSRCTKPSDVASVDSALMLAALDDKDAKNALDKQLSKHAATHLDAMYLRAALQHLLLPR
eukprot:6061068-Pleurochrysis_carterae.AAC.1